ncbi:hypothetical protein PCE1_002791 [Barthelona sp. PCE]
MILNQLFVTYILTFCDGGYEKVIVPCTAIFHTDIIIEIFKSLNFMLASPTSCNKNIFFSETWTSPLCSISLSPQGNDVIEAAAYYLREMTHFFTESEMDTYQLDIPLIYPDFPPQFSMKHLLKNGSFTRDSFFREQAAKKDVVAKYKENTSINVPFWVDVIKGAFAGPLKPNMRGNLSAFLKKFCESLKYFSVENETEQRITIPNQNFLTEYGLDNLVVDMGCSLPNLKATFAVKEARFLSGAKVIKSTSIAKSRLFKPGVRLHAFSTNYHPPITRATWRKYASEIKYDPLLVVRQGELDSIRDEIMGEFDEYIALLGEITQKQKQLLSTMESTETSKVEAQASKKRLDALMGRLGDIKAFFKEFNCLSHFYNITLSESQRDQVIGACVLCRGFSVDIEDAVVEIFKCFGNDYEFLLHALKFNRTSPLAMNNLLSMIRYFSGDQLNTFMKDITDICENQLGVTSTKMVICLARQIAMHDRTLDVDDFILMIWKKRISIDVRLVLFNIAVEVIMSLFESNGDWTNSPMFTIFTESAERYITNKELLKEMCKLFTALKKRLDHEAWLEIYPQLERSVILPVLRFEPEGEKAKPINKRCMLHVVRHCSLQLARAYDSIVSDELGEWCMDSVDVICMDYNNSIPGLGLLVYKTLGREAYSKFVEGVYDFKNILDKKNLHPNMVTKPLKTGMKVNYNQYRIELFKYSAHPLKYSHTVYAEEPEFLDLVFATAVNMMDKYPFIDVSNNFILLMGVREVEFVEAIDYICRFAIATPNVRGAQHYSFKTPTPEEFVSSIKKLGKKRLYSWIVFFLKYFCSKPEEGRILFAPLHEEMPEAYQRCLLQDTTGLIGHIQCVLEGKKPEEGGRGRRMKTYHQQSFGFGHSTMQHTYTNLAFGSKKAMSEKQVIGRYVTNFGNIRDLRFSTYVSLDQQTVAQPSVLPNQIRRTGSGRHKVARKKTLFS